MNDPMIIAAAAVLVIAAISTAVVAIISAVGKMRIDLKEQMKGHADAVEAKVDEVKITANEISGLVNGNATVGADKIDVLEQRIMQLHARLEEVQERRVEDAKTKAATETRSQ